MAEYVVVPARQAIPIGDLDVAQAAPLTDAGLTPYHAINVTRRSLRPTSTVVVIGVGGLQLARETGAHDIVRSDAQAIATIREIVGPPPGGADVVLDFVGLAGGSLPVGFGTVPFEARLLVPFWGTRAELAEVIALARARRIRAHVERFPLADVQDAYDRLRGGQLKGRAVVMPHQTAA
jgi:propanol-preferring alcohol dehydrogenase